MKKNRSKKKNNNIKSNNTQSLDAVKQSNDKSGNGLVYYLKDNYIEIIAFIVLCVIFYFQIVKAGISTHDDLSNLYKSRMGIFFDEYRGFKGNRLGQVYLNIIPSWLMAICKSMWVYKLYTMLGLVVACLSFIQIGKKLFGKKGAWIAVILFWLFAQFNVDHDGLYSFGFSYQMNIAYLFIALALYYDYLTHHKKATMIASAIFYVISAMSYEAFVPYGILFFIMDLYHLAKEKKINIKSIIMDLWLHFILVVIYFIVYVFVVANSGRSNGDATISAGITLSQYLISAWKLAFGMAPLNYQVYDGNTALTLCTEGSFRNIAAWVVIILVTVVVCRAITKSEKISLKKYIYISIGCLTGTLLCGVLVALNSTHVNWLVNGVVKSYGVSYYGYFFIVAWIGMTICAIYHLLPWKKAWIGVCGITIAFVSMFTFTSNTFFIDYMAKRQCKWDLFVNIVETDEFAGIENGAQIYAPEYTGIHNDINTLSNYANHMAGTDIQVVNDSNLLDNSKSIYFLDYDENNDALYLSPVYGNGIMDSVYVYRLDSLSGYGVQAQREGADVADLYVNEQIVGSFGTEIANGNVDISDNSMIVKCRGMKMGTFTLTNGQ